MTDRKLLTATMIMFGMCALLLTPVLAGAQPGEVLVDTFGPDSPIVAPGEEVTGEELLELAKESGLWFVIVGLCVYFLTNALLGKATIKGWRVHFGKFSTWLNGKGARWKWYVITGLSGIAGAFIGLGGIDGAWTWKTVLFACGEGLVNGIVVALTAQAMNDKRRIDKNGKTPVG